MQPLSPPSDIDHFFRHSPVDHEILAGDETALLRCEKDGHGGDILDPPHPTGRMLLMIGLGQRLRPPPVVLLPGGNIDPAGADAVHPDLGSETDGERMGEGGEPSF